MGKAWTPYAVYCAARASRTMSPPRRFPLSRCGNDPALLFAAMLGTEDGMRANLNPEFRVPTESNFMQALSRVLGAVAPLATAEARARIAPSNGTAPGTSTPLLDDILSNE